MSREKLLINDSKSNNSEDMSNKQIEEKNCKDCLHFEACCKWTDFPKQIGFPTCRKFVPISGYRKQEWISVDDRLPELEDGRNWGNHRPRSIRVLCVCQQRSGKTFVKEGYYELFSNKPCWRIPGSIDSVTHWMPLPEAPKGGAE